MKLKEEHIIKAGGTYYTDKFNTKWIVLDVEPDDEENPDAGGRSKFQFYNTGDGFNVYISDKHEINCQSVQFTFVKSLEKFKLLCSVKRHES